MRLGMLGTVLAVVVVAGLLLVPAHATGQAPPAAAAGHPLRTADGQPNMQGFWGAQGGGARWTWNIETGRDPNHDTILGLKLTEESLIVDPPDGKIPYQPWAAAKRKAYYDVRESPPTPAMFDPVTLCKPAGVPRIHYQPGGSVRILQIPGYVVFLAEFQHAYRVVPLDGRPHVGNTIGMWMGDSRGRWEGNTLVVDVTNRNGRSWFDWSGNFQSDTLHMIERWTLVDIDVIRYEATVEDPKVYTRPWRMTINLVRNNPMNYEQWEYACNEGNHSYEIFDKK